MISENFSKTLAKEVFLVDFHGCSGTPVESMHLGTIEVLLHTHQTWVPDSPVPLYVALRVLRARQAKIVSPDVIIKLCTDQLKPFGETHA